LKFREDAMKKNMLRSWLLMGLILLLASISASGCLPSEDQVATGVALTWTAFPTRSPRPTRTATPTRWPSATWIPSRTLLPSLTPVSDVLPAGYRTYTNTSYGIAFDYPPEWQVTEQVLQPGTDLTYRSHDRYDIHTGDHEYLVVDVIKSWTWILEIVAAKIPQPCGGYGPNVDDDTYVHMQVLGRPAARARIETGNVWSVPDADFFTLPVVFYKAPRVCTGDWPGNFIPRNQVVFLWAYDNGGIPLMLEITYYSDQFTGPNLRNRTLDYPTISEMDGIVQRLRLLPDN
jgi:hypothetical protein